MTPRNVPHRYLRVHGNLETDKRWRKILEEEDETFAKPQVITEESIEIEDEPIEMMSVVSTTEDMLKLKLEGPDRKAVRRMIKYMNEVRASSRPMQHRNSRGYLVDGTLEDAINKRYDWNGKLPTNEIINDILPLLSANTLDMEPEEKGEVVAPAETPAENVEVAESTEVAEEKVENAEG